MIDTGAISRYSIEGFCPICEKEVIFEATSDREIPPRWWKNWFRGALRCGNCASIPRERALFHVLTMLRPNWRSLKMHESSPARRSASLRFTSDCPQYIETQYDENVPFGAIHPARGYRSEDLQSQTFDDASFDVVITQDVFEHLLAPDRAIREIARTLRPGGLFVMTVPLVQKHSPSRRRAVLRNGLIEHLLPAQYHGNPMNGSEALVTVDWGYDILPYLGAHSGLVCFLYSIDDLSRGIRAEHNDVIVCEKILNVPELL